MWVYTQRAAIGDQNVGGFQPGSQFHGVTLPKPLDRGWRSGGGPGVGRMCLAEDALLWLLIPFAKLSGCYPSATVVSTGDIAVWLAGFVLRVDAELPNLKSLLRRVIGQIFNEMEIKGWCRETQRGKTMPPMRRPGVLGGKTCRQHSEPSPPNYPAFWGAAGMLPESCRAPSHAAAFWSAVAEGQGAGLPRRRRFRPLPRRTQTRRHRKGASQLHALHVRSATARWSARRGGWDASTHPARSPRGSGAKGMTAVLNVPHFPEPDDMRRFQQRFY